MEICLNCGTKLRGKYCHHCGQEKITRKFTVPSIVKEFLRNSLHWESTLAKTYKELFTHPGIFIRNYIAGKRKNYSKPVSFYIIILTAYVVLFHLLNENYLEPLAKANMIASGESDIIFGPVTSHEFIFIFSKYINYIAFIAPLILAAITMLIFRNNRNDEGEKYSYAEYLIFAFYTQSACLIISSVFILISMIYISIWNYNVPAVSLFSVYSITQFTKSKLLPGIIKSFLTILITDLLYLCIIFIFVFGYISIFHN